MSALDRAMKEGSFYRQLLELSSQSGPSEFLKDALATVADVTSATQGYIQIQRDVDADEDLEWISFGCTQEDVQVIRDSISHGVIAEAIATGETIQTIASSDLRFEENASVTGNSINGVLCAPLGREPTSGVVYLQRRNASTAFSKADRGLVEDFARYITYQLGALLSNISRQEVSDPTQRFRSQMSLEAVVGRSPALALVLNDAALVAPRTISVLLTGEPGTGKTQFGRIIHNNSSRAGGRLVEVNCANLIDSLVESELFGSLKGAATDVETREGKVAAAEGGTLFLDEIGELTDAAQAKLLMLLNDRVYHRVGDAMPRTADVRVIAATNKDIELSVEEGAFRKDLLDRIGVMRINVPALRERREDIPELAERLIRIASERHDLPKLQLSLGALRALQAHNWPGNIRELENHLVAGLLRASGESGRQIERHHIFPVANSAAADSFEQEPRTLQDAVDRAQASIIKDTLEEMNWNVKSTAERLGCSRTHLHSLLNLYEIKRPKRTN